MEMSYFIDTRYVYVHIHQAAHLKFVHIQCVNYISILKSIQDRGSK